MGKHCRQVISILLQIWEVSHSKLRLKTGYPDHGFCGLSQFLQTNAETVP